MRELPACARELDRSDDDRPDSLKLVLRALRAEAAAVEHDRIEDQEGAEPQRAERKDVRRPAVATSAQLDDEQRCNDGEDKSPASL